MLVYVESLLLHAAFAIASMGRRVAAWTVRVGGHRDQGRAGRHVSGDGPRAAGQRGPTPARAYAPGTRRPPGDLSTKVVPGSRGVRAPLLVSLWGVFGSGRL